MHIYHMLIPYQKAAWAHVKAEIYITDIRMVLFISITGQATHILHVFIIINALWLCIMATFYIEVLSIVFSLGR